MGWDVIEDEDEDVVVLFAIPPCVAAGAMCYDLFFFPLTTRKTMVG